MLSNAYLLAKFRFDTAENERHFAEICQKLPTTRQHNAILRFFSRVPAEAFKVPPMSAKVDGAEHEE